MYPPPDPLPAESRRGRSFVCLSDFCLLPLRLCTVAPCAFGISKKPLALHDFYSRITMETVVSGIRSTGNLHLGNYFGAVRNFLKMQKENHCYFFIADYHSI